MSKWVSMKELFEALTQNMSAADVKSAMVISDIELKKKRKKKKTKER